MAPHSICITSSLELIRFLISDRAYTQSGEARFLKSHKVPGTDELQPPFFNYDEVLALDLTTPKYDLRKESNA